MEKRRIGYGRVSSREQAINSNAKAQQIARLEAAGCTEIYFDDESGWKGQRRHDLKKVMDLVKRREADEVVITRLDRLSRDRQFKGFALLGEFIKAKVNLIALDQAFDLGTAAGRAMAGQLMVWAQYDSDNKAESVRHGWEYLRRQKIAVNPPFGYRISSDRRYEFDTTPILCLLEGRKERSPTEIARELIAWWWEKRSLEGAIRCLNEKYGIQVYAHHRKKGGRLGHHVLKFSKGGFRNWLLNPVLVGDTKYLKKSTDKKPMLAKDTHEDVLMSHSDQEQIRQILEHNRSHHGYRVNQQRHPLAGLVVCGECRATCYSVSGNRGKQPGLNYYWQCKNWRARACSQKKMIRVEIVEQAAIAALVAAASSVDKFARSPKPKTESPEIQRIREEIDYYKNAPGQKAKGLIAQLEMELEALQQSLPETEIDSNLIQAYQSPKYWKKLTVEQRQMLYPALISEIKVKEGEVKNIELKI